jgi:UV DNA damage endonuclease
MNSPDPAVVARSVADLLAHAEMAEWTHADTINIHAGGAYGDKRAALDRLERNLERLPTRVGSRLALENDDRTFTPADLLPVCRRSGIPMVYDVHHHRCNPDGQSVESATRAARKTWNREPLFHISSPIEGWEGTRPERHHDYIDIADFPAAWLRLPVTVEVEAKAKELAVARLRDELRRRTRREPSPGKR